MVRVRVLIIPTIVVGRGIVSEENLEAIKGMGMKYIVAQNTLFIGVIPDGSETLINKKDLTD